ncbi:hypothetical protein ACG873_01850 (plasmid) [Mesorhizobium sp. AaZ16]|uniref:hypothetical protein n=1 Tax=Mesorhizobium sp. AaZ16 TaxID=3402289 RepID=UPI00374FD44C
MSRRNRLALFGMSLAAAAMLSGCADYLNHYDTVTLAAGDAHKHNMLLHTDDPFNPAAENTAIPTDGQRAADAVILYRTAHQPGAAPPQNVTVNVATPAQ